MFLASGFWSFRDVLGQGRARDVGRNPFYELRWNLNDGPVGIAVEAVLITDSVVHTVMLRLGAWRIADVKLDLQLVHLVISMGIVRPETY
jgi:hypothetical protein